MSTTSPDLPDLERRVASEVDRQRLLATATELVAVPSPTGAAGGAADRLAELVRADGFEVDRIGAGHDAAPAVVVRLEGGTPGPVLQFDGHLDTVHLPFRPPQADARFLRGSGAADMKGGLAAALEALRVLRQLGLPRRGSVLFVAHDLHEAPWGYGEQLETLIREGVRGDAVLIPEPLCANLPVAGRGAAVWNVSIRRGGEPVHEVMRPPDEPSVLAALADLVLELERLDARLATDSHPVAGSASIFVGQAHGGEIYNGYPRESAIEGTRRWLPGQSAEAAESELRTLCAELAQRRSVTVELEFQPIRGAFALDEDSSLVRAFDEAFASLSDRPLTRGPKPFVDDGNSFSALAGIPAITHGPRAGGQHTVEEWVEIDDLVRVARLYAMTSALFGERSEDRG